MVTPEQVNVNGFEFTVLPPDPNTGIRGGENSRIRIYSVPIPGGLTRKKMEYLDTQGGTWIGRLNDDWDVALWALRLEGEAVTEQSVPDKQYTLVRLLRGIELDPPAPDDFWFDVMTPFPIDRLTEQQRHFLLTAVGSLLRGMQEAEA